MPFDGHCNLGRIGAFDGNQHHTGIGKNLRIVGQCQLIGSNVVRSTLETCHVKSVAFDLADDARSRQQRDAVTGGRKPAADETADAAGSGHDDRLVWCHPELPLLPAVSIAEFTARRLLKLVRSRAL